MNGRTGTRIKTAVLLLFSLGSILLSVGVGSVFISPKDTAAILWDSLFHTGLPETMDPIYPDLILSLRLPRVLMAFLTGAAMALGGAVMQSVLQNPLASPYGLGISSGAGLGAAIVMVTGLSSGILGALFLPGVSLLSGLLTVILTMGVCAKLDRGMGNTTIILIGMVFSLFLNAVMSLLATSSPQHAQRISLWQLGSFSMKEWHEVVILFCAVLLCFFIFLWNSEKLDILTFGEEQAAALGVNLKGSKWLLLCTVAAVTGAAVAFVGIIGFVDLIAPHIVRRFFGSSHKKVLPASALLGGSFLTLCDLLSRTLTPPREIPIGAITALLGAPFFLYLYFVGKRREAGC